MYIDLFNLLTQLIENKIHNDSNLRSPASSVNIQDEMLSCMSNLSDEMTLVMSEKEILSQISKKTDPDRRSVFHKMYSEEEVIDVGKSPRKTLKLNEIIEMKKLCAQLERQKTAKNEESNISSISNGQSILNSPFKNLPSLNSPNTYSIDLSIQLEDLKKLGNKKFQETWPNYPIEMMKFERNFFFFVDVQDSEKAKLPKKGLSAFNIFSSQKRNEKYISELSSIFPSVDFVRKNQKNLSQISTNCFFKLNK